MAESLAEIDPNTENGMEGRALIRKMYKLKGIEAEENIPMMPETPEECVEKVAGKVLEIEMLQEDIDKATSFRNFFADVYCAAYVNSLVTMKDGLSQIFPGGLDFLIEEELQRVYGPFEAESLDMIEIAAIEAYFGSVMEGTFIVDESTLIPAVTPLEGALNLCEAEVTNEIGQAKQDREDYLNDLNFLSFLQAM